MSETETSETGDKKPAKDDHTFLVVVDESDELQQALFYACQTAVRTNGRVALLKVVAPAEFQHWASVGELMREEQREEAEDLLRTISAGVQQRTGSMPIMHIREGEIEEELVSLINEDESICTLVLGAATGDYGPGPLVSALVNQLSGKLRVPITVVPGSLTQAQISAIT
jgi:nucleotide-binding universal stress UspA family protein